MYLYLYLIACMLNDNLQVSSSLPFCVYLYFGSACLTLFCFVSGGGLGVSVFPYQSDDPSLNPAKD